MQALTIPNIFFNGWFWILISLPAVIILHFLRKKSPPPFPKTGKFLKNQKLAFRKIADVLLICMVLFCWSNLFLYVRDFYKLSSQSVSMPSEIRKFELGFLLISSIFYSGISGLFLGLISVFQSNLTKTKRIILLIACLLPVVFTGLLMQIDTILGPWPITRLFLNASMLSWIINAPAIFLNKPFIKFLEDFVQKLKSAFGYHSV
jgi:hypothetical protein